MNKRPAREALESSMLADVENARAKYELSPTPENREAYHARLQAFVKLTVYNQIPEVPEVPESVPEVSTSKASGVPSEVNT